MAKAEPESLYKPAEACKMAEVAPYVLRYWETEFPVLAESRERAGGKFYSGRDVKIIGRIRELLYDEGFTVAGAKKRLESEIAEGRFDSGLAPAPPPSDQKRAAKVAADVEQTPPLFVSDGPARAAKGGTVSAMPPVKAVPAPPSNDFPERKRVLKELKEIAKLLDRRPR
ncbi:MAG TPA: MerR family transcriptional regulator [Thermoanaerobaculia bacterium]|nr:MerR family transcriptional regulator [Thermoanaerobaculia bacterium]